MRCLTDELNEKLQIGQYSPQLNEFLLHILELQHQRKKQKENKKEEEEEHQDHSHVQAGVELQSPSRHTLCLTPNKNRASFAIPA